MPSLSMSMVSDPLYTSRLNDDYVILFFLLLNNSFNIPHYFSDNLIYDMISEKQTAEIFFR